MKRTTLRLLLLAVAIICSIGSYGQMKRVILSQETINQQTKQRDAIKVAVKQQLSLYPESHLCDIYKNFFQDQFGPGHLLSDTAASARYLRSELESRDSFDGVEYEPTGYRGNFYRVNLSVIKKGKVSYEQYLSWFIASGSAFKPIDIDAWREEWTLIADVIREMNLDLPNYDEESQRIEQMLKEGKYVMHHSEAFNRAYDVHYRIIEHEIFETQIKPLL